jgi:hypothetical protein
MPLKEHRSPENKGKELKREERGDRGVQKDGS